MESHIYLCPNEECVVETWLVQPHPARSDAWYISDRWSEQAHTNIATTPHCPQCQAALVPEIAPIASEHTPPSDEVFAELLLATLDTEHVRSLNDLAVALVSSGSVFQIRRALSSLLQQGEVTRTASRRGVWYHGYIRAQTTGADDIPAPFLASFASAVPHSRSHPER